MSKLKGIYLASFKAYHPNYDIVYQDINGKRDIGGDMMEVDLTPYDFIIATPPCNWYSKANYRRNTSEYALKTKHLLPDIIEKLNVLSKPFIVENVQNNSLIPHKWDKILYVYILGRHTYWSNIPFKYDDLEFPVQQKQKFAKTKRQGGENVHKVIERWLETIHEIYKNR